MLLANEDFIPYLLSGLFLESDHPRANLKDSVKAWNQQMHCECLAQLALFPAGRDALLANPAVIVALQSIVKCPLHPYAREMAEVALIALGEKEQQTHSSKQRTWVMLSYQWSHQTTMVRMNKSLLERGYSTWFDLTNMNGSTMDAMSEAVEGAEVMLYGVSLAYKESTNCRLEANYGHQQGLEMIPLMMQENFKPNGWLGLLMGTRVWYPFWDAETDDDILFERRVDAVVKEIGERGRSIVYVPQARQATGELSPTQPAAACGTLGTSSKPLLQHPRRSKTSAPTPNSDQAADNVHSSRAIVSLIELIKSEREESRKEIREMQAQMQKWRVEADQQRQSMECMIMEAKLAMEQEKYEAVKAQLHAQHLTLLQNRIESMHLAKLLVEEERFELEDTISDSIELLGDDNNCVPQMIALSQSTVCDKLFARQLKRKFLRV